MSIYALIVAAGRGERLQGDKPKQYRLLGGVPVLRHSLARLAAHDRIDGVCAVIRREDMADYETAAEGLPLLPPVIGGDRRQDSVRHGLESLAARAAGGDAPVRVLVHDAARPFVSAALVSRVVEGLKTAPAVVPALGVVDTLKRGDGGWVTETPPRDGLYRAQTPQGFHLSPLLAAHRSGLAEDATDDAALMELAGHPVALVAGDENAFKVTTPDDMERARAMIDAMMETRIGQGFDVHRFGPGDHVTLGGVRIPHDHGLVGFSDADVGMHAVTDALLGAIGQGDIGQHFPPGDPRWAGAPSARFLEDVRTRIDAAGGRIVHIDLTLICESPRIGPHRVAMIASIADALDIAPDRVSVKATTTEGLGFTGRGEGIAGQAVASVAMPRETF